jgi:hypothetical protein
MLLESGWKFMAFIDDENFGRWGDSYRRIEGGSMPDSSLGKRMSI